MKFITKFKHVSMSQVSQKSLRDRVIITLILFICTLFRAAQFPRCSGGKIITEAVQCAVHAGHAHRAVNEIMRDKLLVAGVVISLRDVLEEKSKVDGKETHDENNQISHDDEHTLDLLRMRSDFQLFL